MFDEPLPTSVPDADPLTRLLVLWTVRAYWASLCQVQLTVDVVPLALVTWV